MFLIPTYVAHSGVHGVGVFTPSPLPAGALVWRFTDGVDLRLSGADLDALPDALEPQLRAYSYREGPDSYVLCMDNAKFMNHSFAPNCDDSDPEGTVTLRPIDADEELTCDYRLFDLDAARDGLAHWKPEEAVTP